MLCRSKRSTSWMALDIENYRAWLGRWRCCRMMRRMCLGVCWSQIWQGMKVRIHGCEQKTCFLRAKLCHFKLCLLIKVNLQPHILGSCCLYHGNLSCFHPYPAPSGQCWEDNLSTTTIAYTVLYSVTYPVLCQPPPIILSSTKLYAISIRLY